MAIGKVSYVGAGPGNPELITVRGRELLHQADLIIHDSGIDHEFFHDCPATTRIIDAGQQGFASEQAVASIARQIIEAAEGGAQVVRLKTGDPLFFSQALDEIDAVKAAGMRLEIVPGVASPLGAGASVSWFESQPLFGKRLLLCRPTQQAHDSARAIQRRGAQSILLPLIEIEPIDDDAALKDALPKLNEVDWVIFTSANGVRRFKRTVERCGKDARVFGQAKVAVIGPGTAKPLEQWGIRPDLVADEHVAEGLVRQILASGPAQSAVLIRALEARDTLPNALKASGMQVNVIAAYKTKKLATEQRQQLQAQLQSRAVNAVLLTSSSMADALVSALGPSAAAIVSSVCVASIGPVTTATLEKQGIAPNLTATSYTVEGLLDALESYYGRQPSGS